MTHRDEPPVLVDFTRKGHQVGMGACGTGPMVNNPGCYTGAAPACSVGCFNAYDCPVGYFVCGIDTLCCAGGTPADYGYACALGYTASTCTATGNCPTSCCNTGDGGSEDTGRTS